MAASGDFSVHGAALRFTVLGFLAGIAYWAAVSFAPKGSVATLWLGAVALRLAIFPCAPGDDIWRYRWEGRVQLAGYNPYLLSPDSPQLAKLQNAESPLINGRDTPAVYPPLTELTFEALEWMHAPVWGYKALFALADLGIVAIVGHLVSRRGMPPGQTAWYAWNPLVVYVSAGGAHFDSLMVLGMMGAIACLALLPRDRVHWRPPVIAWGASLLLGLAIALKATPLVLLPVFAFTLGWRWAVCTLPVAVAVTPLLATLYGFPQAPIFSTLSHFARTSRLNDAVWWLLDPHRQADNLCRAASAAVCFGLAVWQRRDLRRASLWVMGATLVFAPLLHAWYVLWVLPFAAWAGAAARPWFVFSISVFGYFLFWTVNPDPLQWWVEPLWMRVLIYLPPLLAGGWFAISSLCRPAAAP